MLNLAKLFQKQTLAEKLPSAIETTQLQIIQAEFALIEAQCELEAFEQKLKSLISAKSKLEQSFPDSFPPIALGD